MALQIQCPSIFANKPYHHLHLTKTHRFAVKSETPTDPPSESAPKKAKASSQGLGFGSSSPNGEVYSKQQQKKNTGGRASITRRSPVDKTEVFGGGEDDDKAKEMGRNESAFVLAWLGLGGVILVEGLALATSGFLPEEWDKLFVKYLYPSFTPTVVLFIAGTTAYGVIKYLQNEELKVNCNAYNVASLKAPIDGRPHDLIYLT